MARKVKNFVVGPDTQFVTFTLGDKKASGILHSKNDKTIRVHVVDYNRNPISRNLSVRHQGKTIKRHIDKHNVKFLSPGTVPAGLKIKNA